MPAGRPGHFDANTLRASHKVMYSNHEAGPTAAADPRGRFDQSRGGAVARGQRHHAVVVARRRLRRPGKPVDSGNVYKHPFKRARTTGTYSPRPPSGPMPIVR